MAERYSSTSAVIDRRRTQARALIGLGLGPTFVGLASDYFRADYGAHSLQMALYALAPMYLIAALLFLWLARLIRAEGRTR